MLALSGDEVEESLSHAFGSDEQRLELGSVRSAREMVKESYDVCGEHSIARQKPDICIEASGLDVIVSGANVGVASHAPWFVAHDESNLRVRLQPDVANADVRSGPAEFRGPMEVPASSNRAFSSITQATCLPNSAAVMRERTNGVSSPTR